MNQKDIGKFIAACRKKNNLTQAQLAEQLGITDRAVSKWETGNSMPDSSIMLELSQILGITVNELLSGEEIHMENYEIKADENLLALKQRDENNLNKNVVICFIYSLTLMVGIVVCVICDIALSGGLTWSLIPLSSIIFAWVISFPVIILGKRGIAGSLGHCGPAADPIAVCHQWCAVNDDIRTAHENLGHTDYFYPAHRGVHDFCL